MKIFLRNIMIGCGIALLTLAASASHAVTAKADGTDPTVYTYHVTPILAPFYYYVYVQTDNPDPFSFRLNDPDQEGSYAVSENIYADVVYEDESVYRVNGGYIFHADGYSNGGLLTLQQNAGNGSYADTAVQISCETFQSMNEYLIANYTSPDNPFFTNLDQVESFLFQNAIYPKSLRDTNSLNEAMPYPFYAVSPYSELSLNIHLEMYNRYPGGYLMQAAYPFVLDSAGFPGTMAAIAKQLNPDAVIESVPGQHWSRKITLYGESGYYGYAGAGNTYPVYTDSIQKVYRFDNSEGDFFLGGNRPFADYFNLAMEYDRSAEEAKRLYEQSITGEALKATIGSGSWVRVATEGLGYGTAFAYFFPRPDGSICVLSDGWVDGRYVGENEAFETLTSFAEHPTASIVIRNMSYTDMQGVSHQQDVLFRYDSNLDAWSAQDYYLNYGYPQGPLPDDFILTRDEVAALNIDGKANEYVTGGVIYDGRSEPGSPFGNIPVEGIRLSSKETYIALDRGTDLKDLIKFYPENATYQSYYFESLNRSVVDDGWIVSGVAVGDAQVQVISLDGGYSETILVHVVECADPEVTYTVHKGSVDISWNAIPSAPLYMVRRMYPDGYYGSYTPEVIGYTTKPFFTDAAPPDGKTYRYSVMCVSPDEAHNVLNKGGNAMSPYITYLNPPEIKSIRSTDLGVELTWDKMDYVSYTIMRKEAGGEWKEYGWKYDDGTFLDQLGEPGKTYYYAVAVRSGSTLLYDTVGRRITFGAAAEPGDVNSDGIVDAKDLTALAKHVAKIVEITDANLLQAADVTGDGIADAKDLTLLAKLVAGIIPAL